MPKLNYSKVSKNFIDKIFNSILDKCIIAIFGAVGLVVTTVVSNNTYRVIAIVAVTMIITALLIIRFLKTEKRTESLKKPVDILKYIKENSQNVEVIKAIKHFHEEIDDLFLEDYFEDTSLNELDVKWSLYNAKEIELSAFIKELYKFLKNNNSNNNESLNRFKEIYNGLVENIVNIELDIAKNRSYTDINDSKLKRDIISNEPYLGYWEKSDDWVIEKMKKHVVEMRNIRKKQNCNSLNILDIGTGTGRLVMTLCKKDDYVCIIDSDKKRLSEAEENIRKEVPECKIKSIENSFEKFKDPDECKKFGLENYFDIIICSHVIQHNSTDVADYFYEIIRKFLISDGTLFLLFPISKSNKEEFVVHGLEFDIVKLKKSDFVKSKKIGNIGKMDIYFKNTDFHTLQTRLSKYNDNSEYWKVTNKESKEMLFEIAESENMVRAYKRVFDKGLVCSIDVKHAQDFFDNNSIHIFTVINECLKKYNPLSGQVSEKSIITSSILSEYWLISDLKSHVMIFDNINHCSAKIVNKVIKEHGVHKDKLKDKEIPSEFLELIPEYNEGFRTERKKDQPVWDIINGSNKSVASIYKTESYYSLILNSEDEVEVEVDTKELLLMKQIPSAIKDTFFKDVETYPDFIVDSEVLDGWFIENNNEVCYFARYDSDWIRIFRTELNITELPCTGKLSIKDHEKFPFNLWNEEDIELKPLLKNKILKLKMEENKETKYTELPKYTIRLISDGSGKYCAYRDKKYNNISELTFNDLCRDQVDGLQILPTHKFVIGDLRNRLKKEGFMVEEDKVYHSFKPKHCFIDKLCLRDQYFNFFILKRLKKVHRKFDIQDCMFVVKKK